MRFHTRQTTASHFGKQSQKRILRMVGVLVFVLVAMKFVGQASFWAWMFPEESGGNASAPDTPPEVVDPKQFKVQTDEHRLKPGEFIAQPAPTVPGADSTTGESADGSVEFPTALLNVVRDNTLSVRRDEAAAYYAVLARARDLPDEALVRAADPDVSFAVLMNQSDQFRGKPISVRGEIRRLLPFAAGPNDYDIEDLWEAWLFTEDSGLNPYRVVCTEIPPGIPRGEELKNAVPVRVTGFFFKKQGYEGKGGLHTAPLLLSKSLRWLPPPPQKEPVGAAWAPWIVGFVVATAFALAATFWWISARDRASQTRSFHRYHQPRPETFEALKSLETDDESDLFRGLAENDRQSADDDSTS